MPTQMRACLADMGVTTALNIAPNDERRNKPVRKVEHMERYGEEHMFVRVHRVGFVVPKVCEGVRPELGSASHECLVLSLGST
jgi:hypothetical protein